jgi:hypothetical protein
MPLALVDCLEIDRDISERRDHVRDIFVVPERALSMSAHRNRRARGSIQTILSV